MKLLNTIHDLIREAEDNLYDASMNESDPIEINKLESSVEESMNLLNIYRRLF